MGLLSPEYKRTIVESTIDSIAKGIIKVTKRTPESELFIHQCQYYLMLLDKCCNNKYDLDKLDDIMIDIFKLIIQGRMFDWLNGKTKRIEFTESMSYYLNIDLLVSKMIIK